jgi:DNA-binding beta-propeller fold protein YncE
MGRRGLIALIVGVVALLGAASASAADSVFWLNAGASDFGRANLTGGGTTVTPGPVKAVTPVGVAVDAAGGKLYWGDEHEGHIYVANLDGSGSAVLPTAGASSGAPEGLIVDHAAGRIYWADNQNDKISWAALNGSGGGNIATGTATVMQPESVAIDPARGRIYWANFLGNRISWASLSGNGEAGDLPIAPALTLDASGIAIDAVTGRLYWTSAEGFGLVASSTLDGLGAAALPIPQDLIEGPRGLAVDPAVGRIYWANENDGTIGSAALDGSAAALLPTTGATTSTVRDPALLKAPHAEGAPLLTATGTTLGSSLTCKAPLWAADPVGAHLSWALATTALGWTLNGAPLAGTAGAVTITATQPGTYSCQASATNAAGTSTIASATVGIAAATAPAPTRVRLAKVKLDRRHGTATILANVSGPGTLTLGGKKVVRRSVKASGAGIAKVKVAAKGGALKTLIRSHKVKVRFALRFLATEGGKATVTRTVVLHRAPHVARPR